MSTREASGSQGRSIYLEDRLWHDLEALAEKSDRSISAEIRRALRLYVLNEGKSA